MQFSHEIIDYHLDLQQNNEQYEHKIQLLYQPTKIKRNCTVVFFEIFSNPTIIKFTTDIAFSSICHKYITPNISVIIINTHRRIRNDV